MMRSPRGEDQATVKYWKHGASRFSKHYDPQHGFSVRKVVGSFLDARSRALGGIGSRGKGSRILDLGCGSGVHMRELVCAHAVGLDYSLQMLALARRGLGAVPGLRSLVLGDASRLPFCNASFDCIVSMGLLDYVASPEDVLAESRRVLVPGGVLVCSFPKSPSLFSPLRSRLGTWVKKHVFDLPQIRNTWSRGQLESALSRSGFELESLASVWTTMWMVRGCRPLGEAGSSDREG
jgi:ubiquinone/menaquinone biosynthesis C-methylase UbiE